MKTEKLKAFFKNKWVKAGLIGAAFVAYSVTLSLWLGTACMSKLLFGLPCPGWGLTRANLAALRLNFHEAFHMHPMWFISVIGVVMLFFALKYPGIRKKKWFNGMWIVLGVVMCIVFVVRLFTTAPQPPLDMWDGSLLNIIINFFRKL